MIKYQHCDVKSWLKSWNEHFPNSTPPRFGPKSVCITTEIRFIQVSSLISKHSSENVKTFEKIHTFYEINQNSLNYKFIIAYQVLHRQTWISGAVKALQNCVRKTRSLLTWGLKSGFAHHCTFVFTATAVRNAEKFWAPPSTANYRLQIWRVAILNSVKCNVTKC